MNIALIPCAGTEWHAAGRLLGRAEVLPTPAGEQACLRWLAALGALKLKRIFHSPDGLARRTAELLGRKLLVPAKETAALAEVDLGLWAGLTEQQIESRYESAHRELAEAPLNVIPPGGEALGDAEARLEEFLRKQGKRNSQAAIGLVLRPVLLGIARCVLAGCAASEIWETARHVDEPVIIEWPRSAAGTTTLRGPDAQ